MKPIYLLAPLLGSLAVGAVRADDAFELKDGDRVVLVGNTLIEREQRYGYWEAALTRRWPARNVIFRNLGWSGDTVFGIARASFDPPEKGFARLKEGVLSLKPTVLVVGYGGNEAFDGEAGLPTFVKGLDALLDALAPAKARVVLLAPPRQEDLGRPLPDPAEHNKNLRLYRDALRDAAKKRGAAFVDLFDLLPADSRAPLTDNGIHLTDQGYWRSAFLLEEGLGLPASGWLVEIDAAAKQVKAAHGTKVEKTAFGPLRFQASDAELPASPPPGGKPKALKGEQRVLRVAGLKPGRYSLSIDGKAVAAAGADEWAAGVALDRGPEFDQSEKLREAVVLKNQLYFHRWRPQNYTYLFGFREKEQGKNAREVPLFDPLVEKQETEIARLRVPAAHTYELKEEAKR
jgi:lysophospholipase L1-like esterase